MMFIAKSIKFESVKGEQLMKKIISILLTAVMITVSASTAALAADDDILFGFDKAAVTGDDVSIPVYLTAVPEGLSGISSVSFKYTFDENHLTYVSTTDGVLTGMDKCNSGVMMWYEGSESAALQNDKLGKDNPLFYVNFKIKDRAEKYTIIKITLTKLTDYDLNPALSSEGDYKVIEGIVYLQNNSGSGESGGETGGEDNPGGGAGTGSGSGSGSGAGTGGSADQGGGLKPGDSNPGGNGGGSSTRPGGSGGSAGGTTITTPPTTAPTAPAEDDKKAKKASEVFSDVADDNWAATFALDLYNRGIVSGDNRGRANLENRITREETSKLALLVNGIEINDAAKIESADAAEVSDWAVGYMATAVEKGIFSGYNDGTIRPSAQITREEMVTVIVKSLGIDTDANASVNFADADKIDWSAPYVAKAVELGFVNGYEDNTFRPANPITRAEAFAIFSRVLEYKTK